MPVDQVAATTMQTFERERSPEAANEPCCADVRDCVDTDIVDTIVSDCVSNLADQTDERVLIDELYRVFAAAGRRGRERGRC
jgi:hypothetical protein